MAIISQDFQAVSQRVPSADLVLDVCLTTSHRHGSFLGSFLQFVIQREAIIVTSHVSCFRSGLMRNSLCETTAE